MSGPSDDDDERARRARKNLKRIAKAVEFEAYEDAELRREEEKRKLSARQAKTGQRPTLAEHLNGRPKGKPSQRGK